MKAPIDQRLIEHVNHLVDEGVYNVDEMKRRIRLFVNSLFCNSNKPNGINRRYCPSREDIRKLIYRRKQQNFHCLLDQQYLLEKVEKWRSGGNVDNWFVRLSEDQEQGHTPLLIVLQTEWQKRLLNLYGKELVFLDATYKTTKYAMPLFFLVVHTNSGYIVVAAMVIEKEDTASLSEALQLLSDMNPA